MGTYKVIQDIEAEDKLLGPFSLRQFIYLIIVALMLFVCYRLALVHIGLVLPFLPPIAFFGLLAAPLGGNQSSEVWLLAKIRFFLKPKRRIWDQSGMQELVTITAPKKIEKHLTKELSQTEVRSRLEALANTIDSRGWAIKNIDVSVFAQPAYALSGASSDRLVDVNAMASPVPGYDVTADDDILDEQNNPTAQNLGRMINASSKAHRDQIVAQMKQGIPPSTPSSPPTPPPRSTPARPASPPPDYWFLNSSANPPGPMTTPQPGPGFTPPPGPVFNPAPGPAPTSPQPSNPPTNQPLTEDELLKKIHAEQGKPKNYGHMRVIKPLAEQQAEAEAAARVAAAQPQTPPVTPPPDPAILGLANNDDLDVATIARQAKKAKDGDEPAADEVVISLH